MFRTGRPNRFLLPVKKWHEHASNYKQAVKQRTEDIKLKTTLQEEQVHDKSNERRRASPIKFTAPLATSYTI